MLLPCLGYYKQCCYEHWGACILLGHVILWSGIGNSTVFKEPSYIGTVFIVFREP